jgi:hypothetical protein
MWRNSFVCGPFSKYFYEKVDDVLTA